MSRGGKTGSTRGAILLVVLMLVLFLSLFSLLLTPMTLLHHKSIVHYGESISMEKLAYGVRELALELLEREWTTAWDSGWVVWNEEHSYRYRISYVSDYERTLDVFVKNNVLERHFSGRVVKSLPVLSLKDMAGYGIYSTEDLFIEDLAKIRATPPLVGIGTLKNMNIFNFGGPNRLNMHINGNIYLESIRWESFHNSYVLNPSVLPLYDDIMMGEFIYLLQNRCGDRMGIEGNQYSQVVDLGSMPDDLDVFVVENVEELTVGGSFSGLLILRRCNRVVLEDVEITGMMILSGCQVHSMVDGRIHGVFGLVETFGSTPLDLELEYDPQFLTGLEEYLTMEITEPANRGQVYVEEFTQSQ
ncbi:hypothetical protein J0B03_00715 [Alkalibacter rhizosphaerae]|uniref:Uncharacterized protein n=1 Tax=Alkalibacter rhizosphaerae TaxID=2815577 RepID=A0A975AHN9_9FIRM|nr:hypothetical protein [Alkalibacter rhizosphaerae]QSX08647.1 hypothetical protein J0B03_00715 [Alkalibacter rhizosphaerae]